MKTNRFLLTLSALVALSLTGANAQTADAPAAPSTRSHHEADSDSPAIAATRKLLPGKHALTLQWLPEDKPGAATIVAKPDGTYSLTGEQKSGGDLVEVKGEIIEVIPHGFKLKGTITTKVSHIAQGEAVPRDGTFTFLSTKNRKYWRLQEMANPKDVPVVDYVDVYFK